MSDDKDKSGPAEGVRGVVEDVKGKTKEAVGNVVGQDDLAREGHAQQEKAEAQRDAAKKEAEAEGLDRIFIDAGAEWRESGCSMCLGMNGDLVPKGQYSVSTSNRNFEGRQGVGARTLLASPLTAAASAVRGCVTDPRELLA